MVGAALAVVGLLAGVALLAGDASYLDSARDTTVSSLDGARRFWPAWPDVARRDAQLLAIRAQQTGVASDARRRAGRGLQARRRDPASALSWVEIGDLESIWGTPARAEAAYRGALARNPWSSGALEALLRQARAAKDAKAAARYRHAMCEVRILHCGSSG